ncbi:MAG: hypothetical protein IJ545_05760 [Alphaproteobacteria bacterium]|nr:hypothetical protein [Alphaproteobacteria bacterium]
MGTMSKIKAFSLLCRKDLLFFTYASKNKRFEVYWATPEPKVLSND